MLGEGTVANERLGFLEEGKGRSCVKLDTPVYLCLLHMVTANFNTPYKQLKNAKTNLL